MARIVRGGLDAALVFLRGRYPMDRLTSLNAFMNAAETGSFAAAGRALGVSASAIGKSIARLEDRVGVRLLHRSTRRIALTDDGERFLQRCQRIFQEVEAAEQELAKAVTKISGRLRVGMPLMAMRLVETIGRFTKTHRNIQLELDFCDRPFEMIEDGLDVALRFGELPDSTLMTKSLGRFPLVIVASEDYLRCHGWPQSPADLGTHICLLQRSLATGKPERWPLLDMTGAAVGESPVAISASAVEALIDLALNGLGIACVPLFLAQDHIAARRLHPVLTDCLIHPLPLRLIWPSNRHLSPKVKAFVEYMSKCPQISELSALEKPHEPLATEPMVAASRIMSMVA
jgi:DNA-binding transcriptional LysR family regulator